MFEAVLPYPPSVNGLYRNVAGKGRVKTQAYQRWLNAAAWDIAEAWPGMPIQGPIHISIEVKRRSQRKADLDNLAKACIDLLVSQAVIDDDRHVDELYMCWADDRVEWKGARVTVATMQERAA